MKVQTVIIGGNEYKLALSMEALLWAAKDIGRPLQDLLVDIESLYEYEYMKVMYAFVKFGAEYSRQKPIGFNDFLMLLMKNPDASEEMARVLEGFSEELAKELGIHEIEKKD